MYLLDTDIVFELRNAKAGGTDPGLAGWAAGVARSSLFISAVTLLELETGVARVITSGASYKVLHVLAGGEDGAPAAVCQVDGRRWSTLEGRAVVRREPEAVADAERRYAARYRTPRVNPQRVVLEIAVDRVLGSLPG
jgi:predicted nucleic acid-binding protein